MVTVLLRAMVWVLLSCLWIPSGWAQPKRAGFYEKLREILDDFEHDLNTGTVPGGLSVVSIRHVQVNERTPPTFKEHVRFLIEKKINTIENARVVACPLCLDTGIPKAAADKYVEAEGIREWVDAHFDYQDTSLILSVQIIDAASENIRWSRVYSSQTSRAEYTRKGINPDEYQRMRRSMIDYRRGFVWKPHVLLGLEKDVTAYTTLLNFGFQFLERYDLHRKEVGIEVNYHLDVVGFLRGSADTQERPEAIYTQPTWSALFVHHWNLIEVPENTDIQRIALSAGVGATYSLRGYLSAIVRAGGEWRLGKHWSLVSYLGYRPSAPAGPSQTRISGVSFAGGVTAAF